MLMVYTDHGLIRNGISEIAVLRLWVLKSSIRGMMEMPAKKLKGLRFRTQWATLPDVVGDECMYYKGCPNLGRSNHTQ